MKLTKRLYRKFLRSVKFTDNCWLWRGGRVGGYGSFYWNSVQYRAHRLAITLFLDPSYDPEGRGLDGDYATHDCDVKLCVSPHCLRIGTASSNTQEAYSRGRIDVRKMSIAHMGHRVSEETRRKMSNARVGYRVSEETRRKLSAALRGHEISEETRKKMSIAKIGRKHSEKHRRKISEALMGNQNALGCSYRRSEETKRK